MKSHAPDRVRLLEFVTFLGIGGTERQLVNLVTRLDEKKFDLHIACMRTGGQFQREIERSGIPVREYVVQSLHGYGTAKQNRGPAHVRVLLERVRDSRGAVGWCAGDRRIDSRYRRAAYPHAETRSK